MIFIIKIININFNLFQNINHIDRFFKNNYIKKLNKIGIIAIILGS